MDETVFALFHLPKIGTGRIGPDGLAFYAFITASLSNLTERAQDLAPGRYVAVASYNGSDPSRRVGPILIEVAPARKPVSVVFPATHNRID